MSVKSQTWHKNDRGSSSHTKKVTQDLDAALASAEEDDESGVPKDLLETSQAFEVKFEQEKLNDLANRIIKAFETHHIKPNKGFGAESETPPQEVINSLESTTEKLRNGQIERISPDEAPDEHFSNRHRNAIRKRGTHNEQ